MAQEKAQTQTVSGRPNIVFVLTDDQHKNTLTAMPNVRDRLQAMGTTFDNAYVTQSLCCPSRASILRGQYPHNTGIEANGPPEGGAEKFRNSGKESATIATRLRSSGYDTGIVGKYMNGYDASWTPPGWSYTYLRADPNTPGALVREDGVAKDTSGDPLSSVERAQERALAYLDRRTDQAADGPFALFFWTGQPHLPAGNYSPRYENLFQDAQVPRTPAFDEADVSDKPQWIRNTPRLTDAEKNTLDNWRRNQMRSSKQVDDQIGNMLDLLRDRGELDNTYFVFTSDNSTHMGEHRWMKDTGAKNTPYEEAANVPYVVRGPGVPANQNSPELVTNNDFAPTFDAIANTNTPSFTDGRSVLSAWKGGTLARTGILNERGSIGGLTKIPLYKAVMTKTRTYVEWGTGERELYGRVSDPHQLDNAYDPQNPPTALQEQLDALKVCAGASCRAAEDR